MPRSGGFTLIELIMVIILLGIVATISVQFVTLSTRGAIDVSERQKRALKGVVISERLSRELREAVPGSVNVSSDGRCLSFVPARGAGIYQEVLDESTGQVRFDAVTGYDDEQYDAVVASPSGSLTTLDELNDSSLQSPENRFYLVDDSVLLFWSGSPGSPGKLYRQLISGRKGACQDRLPSPQFLLATYLSLPADGRLFDSTNPSTQSSSLISFSFFVGSENSGDSSMAFSQTLQVRNVP